MGEIDTSPEDVSRFKDEWAKLERESLTAGRDAALAHVEWWRDKCAEADDLAQALAARVAELEISLEAKESAAQSALNDAWAERDEIQRNLTAMQESAAEFLCDREAARAEAARLREALNTPELHDFSAGVVAEAQHQRERWGAQHDAGKSPEDWFWLVGYLAGKALHAAKTSDQDKALHHCISTAAALANWHAAVLGAHTEMRPGIGEGSAVYPAAQAALSQKDAEQ